MREKKEREDDENQEKKMYEALMVEHVKLLGQRENEKNEAQMKKIMAEKESRDKQLREEKARKRAEQKELFRAEVDLVNRLKDEMEAERKVQEEKRRQEKEYLKRMLIENEQNKVDQQNARQQEMKSDVLAQEEYAKMLDKQEADRIREFRERENRAQTFMNTLASTVISKQQGRISAENENIKRYEMEKELKARIEDERRAERDRLEKQEMRRLLAQQMEEKRLREAHEKALNDEQAVIWAQDKKNYELEEDRLSKKIKGINRDNQSFLQQQMQDKASKAAMRRMNK